MAIVIQVRPLLLFVDGDLFYSKLGVEQVTIHKKVAKASLESHKSFTNMLLKEFKSKTDQLIFLLSESSITATYTSDR